MILVADGRTALLFDNTGTTLRPRLLQRRVLDAPDNPLTREQGADRPGRSFQSVGSRRSALEPTNWHRLGEERFAREIAAVLEELRAARMLHELTIVSRRPLYPVLHLAIPRESCWCDRRFRRI